MCWVHAKCTVRRNQFDVVEVAFAQTFTFEVDELCRCQAFCLEVGKQTHRSFLSFKHVGLESLLHRLLLRRCACWSVLLTLSHAHSNNRLTCWLIDRLDLVTVHAALDSLSTSN